MYEGVRAGVVRCRSCRVPSPVWRKVSLRGEVTPTYAKLVCYVLRDCQCAEIVVSTRDAREMTL